jgi:hypothetical protein
MAKEIKYQIPLGRKIAIILEKEHKAMRKGKKLDGRSRGKLSEYYTIRDLLRERGADRVFTVAPPLGKSVSTNTINVIANERIESINATDIWNLFDHIAEIGNKLVYVQTKTNQFRSARKEIEEYANQREHFYWMLYIWTYNEDGSYSKQIITNLD